MVVIALYLTHVLWNTSPKLLVRGFGVGGGVCANGPGGGVMVGGQREMTHSHKKVKEDSLSMIPEPTSTLDGTMTVVL